MSEARNPLVETQRRYLDLLADRDAWKARAEQAERDRDAEAENARLMQDRLTRLIDGRQESECVVCGAALEPVRRDPPHCEDCLLTEQHLEAGDE